MKQPIRTKDFKLILGVLDLFYLPTSAPSSPAFLKNMPFKGNEIAMILMAMIAFNLFVFDF
jgi:hypothetical protein